MARRPPLDDQKLLELLEAGHGQSDAANILGSPVGTVTGRVKKLRDRAILREDNTVDWDALEDWKKTHPQGALRPSATKPGTPPVYQKSTPQVYPESETLIKPAPDKGTPRVYQDPKFRELLPDLEELISWWKQRKKALSTPAVYQPTRKKTYILSEDLIKAIEEYAGTKGISVTEAINEIVRRGLVE